MADMDGRVAELEELLQQSAEVGLQLSSQNEELKELVSSAAAEKETLQHQLCDLHRKVKELQDAAAVQRASRMSVLRHSHSDSDAMRRMSSDMTEHRHRASSSMLAGIADFSKSGEVSQQHWEELVEEKEEECLELQTAMKGLEERMEGLTEENSKLKAESADLLARLEAEREKAVQNAKQKEVDEVEGAKLKATGAKLWDASSRAQKEKLQQQVETLRTEHQALEEKLQQEDAEKLRLGQELAVERENLQAAQDELLHKEDEMDRLQESMETMEAELSLVKEQLAESQDKLTEERMKRGVDKLRPQRGGKRTITHALSMQVMPEDDEEEDDAAEQERTVALANELDDSNPSEPEEADEGQGALDEKSQQNLRQMRQQLSSFFGVDDEEASSLTSASTTGSMKQIVENEIRLLDGVVDRVLEMSKVCRKLLLSISDGDRGCKASREPEWAAPRGEEDAKLAHATHRATVRFKQSHLELHKDAKANWDDLVVEVKALHAELLRLQTPTLEDQSWYDRFVLAMSCGGRPGRGAPGSAPGPEETNKMAGAALQLDGTS